MGSGLELTFTLGRGEASILVRLLIAGLAGSAIGWNRFRAGKPAGIGTHAFVALGAALFAAIPALISPQGGSDALSRVVQGVATGVGFLGAGEIFRDTSGNRIHGLTSAAALWVTAGLGIVSVCGSLALIAAITAIILFVLVVMPHLERRFRGKSVEPA